MKSTAKLLCIIFFLMGCELYNQNNTFQEYYVVESYLIANDSLPTVRLSKSSDIEIEYNFWNSAVSDAEVEIQLLNADSSLSKRYPYQEERSGIYHPVDSAIVLDQQLYRLQITTPAGDKISAFTYVPGSFKTVSEPQNTYTYQSKQQVEITVSPSTYINNRQTYYIFTVNAVDPKEDNLTPFYADLIESHDNFIGSYYINSSGIISEESYQRDDDGNIKLTIPWLTFAFFGANDVTVNAIDDNMYHFLRSQEVQIGGISIAPGEIRNIQYNITGGIGIFGSMASDTNSVNILKP